jgi:hypothetical protein
VFEKVPPIEHRKIGTVHANTPEMQIALISESCPDAGFSRGRYSSVV